MPLPGGAFGMRIYPPGDQIGAAHAAVMAQLPAISASRRFFRS